MLRRPATGLLVVAVTVGMLGAAAIRGVAGRPGTGTAGPLLAEVFTRPDGLITNEHASWSPSDPAAVVSGTWRVTSGSLFADGNTAWTGVPDDRQPDAGSAHGTGSAVFRLVTRRTDLGDVQVSLRLRNLGLISTASTPPAAWDGVHLFLRYQSQYQLYYASVNRRDATVLVKKKCPGGSENGGTYYLLGDPVGDQPIPVGAWQRLAASVRTNLDGSVSIDIRRNGVLLTHVRDRGLGCAPIRQPGAVGLRGDNDQFRFDDFTVTRASAGG
jgi:hypothetical protein